MKTRDTIAVLRAEAQHGSIGEGYACYVSGMLALDEDDYAIAEAELVHAIKIAEVLGDPSLNLDSRLGISRLYRIQGKIHKALEWAEDALNFAIRVGYRIYQGRAQVELGRARWLSNDLVNAENNLLRAEAVFLDMDLRYDLAEVRLLLAVFNHQKKDSRVEILLPQVVTAIHAGGYSFLVERERTLVYTLATSLNGTKGEMASAVSVLLNLLHAVPPKPLKVITLGSLDVWVGAKNVDGRMLRQRRAGELLVLLLSSPEYTLSFDEVAEALCPDKDPQAAVNFYHHAISSLRRILEPDIPDKRFPCRYLEVSDERITLILPTGSKIDFQEFAYYVQEKDWERAITLYRGEYLPIYCYSEWSMSFRRHLANQFEYALLARATELFNIGDVAGCFLLANRTLEQNAWQEQAVELGMRAALSLGDSAGALKLYKRLEKQLEHDLGIAPQNELQRLYNQAKKSG
jgi:DNA-binding SARP family transcriptional activator